MLKLTKIEQDILLDRLGLPDCIYDAMYRDMAPEYPYGDLSQEEVVDVCRMAEGIVKSGIVPDFGALQISLREIILESFEGGTYFRRIQDTVNDMDDPTEAKKMLRKIKTVMRNLQKKLSVWSEQDVIFQE